MMSRADSSNARNTEAAVYWPEEASEADMVANDNISAGRKTAEPAREPRQHTELVARRRGVVFFLANDNQRLADRDRGARGAGRQDAKALAVLRKLIQGARQLVKLKGVVGAIRAVKGRIAGLHLKLVRQHREGARSEAALDGVGR